MRPRATASRSSTSVRTRCAWWSMPGRRGRATADLQRKGARRARQGHRRGPAAPGEGRARALRGAAALPPAARRHERARRPAWSPPRRCARPPTAPTSSARSRAIGLPCRMISEADEARYAGAGRAVRHPRRRRHGRRPWRRQPRAGRGRRRARPRGGISLPLGVLRRRARRATGASRRSAMIRAALRRQRAGDAAAAGPSTWSADRGARWRGSTWR